ncbi:MAG: LexA family transcriptional regulator [Sulfurovum sp.]|nr:LexA family transcriptional regulator [Sulfurovum sp.]
MFDSKKLMLHMKEKGYTNASIAEAVSNLGVEIKENSFKAYRQNRASPRIEVLCAIAEVLGIAEQELFDNKNHYVKKFLDDNNDEQIIKIPMFKLGTTLDSLNSMDNCDFMHIENKLVKSYGIKNLIAIKIEGDSMLPLCKNNDTVIIELFKNNIFSKIDNIYFMAYGDILQIKRVQFIKEKEISIISLNQDYPSLNPKKDYTILGKLLLKVNVEYF